MIVPEGCQSYQGQMYHSLDKQLELWWKTGIEAITSLCDQNDTISGSCVLRLDYIDCSYVAPFQGCVGTLRLWGSQCILDTCS